MSSLRLIGLLIGILGIIITFFRYRGPRWKRSNFLLLVVINLSIIGVSINPAIVNIPRDLLSLESYVYGGRLLALLIISTLFLLFFSFYSKARQEEIRHQFDKLVRMLGSLDLGKKIDLEGKIKPIMILIPAYNEADNLRYLLPKIPTRINGMEVGVLVVDDGSEDDTVKIVQNHNCLVVSNMLNRGGGAALRLGYDILQSRGQPVCVTMDADGQHQPEEIETLLEPVLADQLDLVIGSRILGTCENDSRIRLFGVYVFGFIIRLMMGQKITDPSSNFRAFKMKAMEAVQLLEDQYHTSELIIEAIKKGIRIGEVPICINKRKYGKTKKGTNLVYGFHFARAILKSWWR